MGGALGSLLRWLLGVWFPDGGYFPATTFGINVVGSLVLALLPAWSLVRRSPVLAVALGPGLLGGFTTLSACAEQDRALLAAGRPGLAATYYLGTAVAAVAAVLLGRRLTSPEGRRRFHDEEGDT